VSLKSTSYLELLMNYMWNVCCIHMKYKRFLPMITNFYLTKKCNLKCRYCYPPGNEPELNIDDVVSLLDKIRPHSPVINFTGGEPLLYKDISYCLQYAKKLRFYPVLLSTNGLLIDRIIDDLQFVDHLIISLDSLSEEVNDDICGVKGVTQKILKNVKHCASISRERAFHLSIHTAITPDNIDDVPEVVSFCRTYNITFSISPEHGRYYPNPELINNKKYKKCINELVRLKKAGLPITSSYHYLKTIRDFSKHECYPYVSPRVEPDGSVYFPCQRMKKRTVYLQDYENLYQLMRNETIWRAGSNCRDRCFLACYIEVEKYLRQPFSLLREIYMNNHVLRKN